MEFADLNLDKFLLMALDDQGLHKPTSIQEKCFSPIMAGKDVVGIAQTGTGKTFAYLLPLLRLWKFSKNESRANVSQRHRFCVFRYSRCSPIAYQRRLC